MNSVKLLRKYGTTGLIILLCLASSPIQSQTKSQESIRIALTGDSIINRRLSVFDGSTSTGLYKIVHEADAGFTNFETLVLDHPTAAFAQSGGLYQSAPAWVLDDLKAIGIDLFSTANNHAYDYGEDGLRSTIKAMDERGLTHAGTGQNLALAREPAYLDTSKGRIALVAVASSFIPDAVASEQRPDGPGRAGVNPLRFNTIYTVDPLTYQVLGVASRLVAQDNANAIIVNSKTSNQPNGYVSIGGVTFQSGAKSSVHTELNKKDLAALISSVHEARRQADWVIVSSHTHESGPGGEDTPPEFLIAAAHAAIDAGADIFVAHGPHILRGIEIYKDKPIFYSLGNFVFENETMAFQPTEIYDSLGLGYNASVADIYDARSLNDTRGFPAQPAVWESIVATVTFNDSHTLNKITLVPISLGFGEPRSERGRPRLASENEDSSIIETITKLSKPFGTKVINRDGSGVISLEKVN